MIFYVATDTAGARHLKGTQADARTIDKDFVQIDVPTDKPGLMAAFQELFTEIDGLRGGSDAYPELTDEQLEGIRAMAPKPEGLIPIHPAPMSYTERSVAIEDNWDALPLALKLHYAAMAMEDARTFVVETKTAQS